MIAISFPDEVLDVGLTFLMVRMSETENKNESLVFVLFKLHKVWGEIHQS